MLKKSKKKKTDNTSGALTDEIHFGVIESYKEIRANINFAVTSKGCKKVLICSAYNGEGKTTVCANLAITIAQTGASVALIDCDLRKPKIHKLLDADNESGVSNYLSNMAEFNEILKDTEVPNLRIITSGSIPPNPAELLATPKMADLLSKTGRIAEYIIIDTPPVCIVSDALPMSKLCDGVILTVNHMETKHPHIKDALEKMNFAGANVVGMILNKIKISRTYKSYKKYGKYLYNNNDAEKY